MPYEANIDREMPLFTFAVNVPRDSYFVLGDNRTNSKDSRAFGSVVGPDIRYRATDIRRGGRSSRDDCS
jgi:signal peptidase I